MSRLIDADILRDEVLNDSTFDNDTVNYYLTTIDNQQTADAAPVVHGKWSYYCTMTDEDYTCSVCGQTVGRGYYPYCPNCGAKMDKEAADGGSD